MKLYFPEAFGTEINYVGYNHAIALFKKALNKHITNDAEKATHRVYFNLPWYPKPKELKKDGLPLVAYTMYESTRVPSTWVKFLNDHFEYIFVPSTFCKETFVSCGVRVPIFILSLGFDPDKIKYSPKVNNGGEPYIYLWQGVAYDRGGRKGVDVVTDAFRQLKKEKRIREDSRLILKYLPYKNKKMTIENVTDVDGVTFTQKLLSREEMDELYSIVDCCINPTHGEGFGLIPLEQMARCKPVLVTDFSMDYVKAGKCIPLDFELKLSPVTWNHKNFTIGVNGISYNTGGLLKEKYFLPKYLRYKPVNGGTEMTALGPVIGKVSFWENIKANVNNFLRGMQKKTGFYQKPDRKCYSIFQEFQGFDAHVDIERLKFEMQWCHDNRRKAELIGYKGYTYVHEEWTLQRMKRDYLNILSELGAI